MTESFGAQSIPISASVGTPVSISASASDPLLTYLGSYLKTAVNTRLGTEFGALMFPNASPAVSADPISVVFDHDPEQWEFVDTKLPGLFMYRNADGGAGIEDLATDWKLTTETISLLWVLPSATQDKQASRARFPSKLFHLVGALIDRNRDPAWIVSGDTDALATTEGSSLATYGAFFRLRLSRGGLRKPLAIPIEGGKSRVYPAYEALLEVRERYLPDTARNALLDGVTVAITTNGVPIGTGAFDT